MTLQDKIKEALLPALRQYKHNNGVEGFLFGYDIDDVQDIVKTLITDELEKRKSWGFAAIFYPVCRGSYIHGHIYKSVTQASFAKDMPSFRAICELIEVE